MSYIGVPPFGQTVRTITELTASAGQTTFNVSGGYLPGYVDVFLNGVSLASGDFTSTNGSTVVLGAAASLNDEFKAIAYWPVSLTDTYRKGEVDSAVAAKVSKTGDTMTGTLQVPQLNIGSRKQFDLTNLADETNIDWNNVTRNSISYALGSSHTNAPLQGINSIVVDLNTEGWGGSNDSGADTRGAQLWFTDTPGNQQGGAVGRFCIRPKQGATWHPWEKVLTTYSFRRNYAMQSGTMVVTGTSWQDISGCSISVTPISAASRFLIMARWAGYFNPSGDAQGRIMRDSTQVYINQRVAGNANTQHESSSNWWLDHPNTTSTVTYKLQGAMTGSTGSMDFGHADNRCQLIIMEFEG